MSRLGSWKPSTFDDRLERVESVNDIRQLAYRYALAVDSRDLDALVELFVPDVRVGRDATGRDALREWFVSHLRRMRVSVHFVGNHIIDFDDANQASGVVYCRDEVEMPDAREWRIGMVQYWDSYARRDGTWYFERRRFHRWYGVDALTRPGHGAGVLDQSGELPSALLPDAFASWRSFWDQAPSDPRPRP